MCSSDLRVKLGGGHAGHNGLRSMHQHIGADYQRVRLGIGHPGHKDRVSGYVLHDFAKSDADWLNDVLRGIGDGAPYLADGDARSEEHTSELQSRRNLVCRLLLEKKKYKTRN